MQYLIKYILLSIKGIWYNGMLISLAEKTELILSQALSYYIVFPSPMGVEGGEQNGNIIEAL